MNVVVFGTYDVGRHPRVQVLIEGLRAQGVQVSECNAPITTATSERVAALRRPIAALRFGVAILRSWNRLRQTARHMTQPDVVIVGYMGHFDVHLARRLWPSAHIVLDHLISAAETARDRGSSGHLLLCDQRATKTADLVLVDTEEHLSLAQGRPALVVPVAAPGGWFREPSARVGSSLRVVFYAMFSPLQGAPIVGEAIRLLDGESVDFTVIGAGQEYESTRRAAAGNRRVNWVDWVEPEKLPAVVAEHDVCLGIFGVTPKAKRVVPNKVFQGAAAGCCVITSDTTPQRRILGEAALFVPPGDPSALASLLRRLSESPEQTLEMRRLAFEWSSGRFRPASAVEDLSRWISGLDWVK
jgi:glycosyltransferase involved in cell wall biosynthesis